MIEKKINKKWVRFDGLKYVKKGDIFRIVNDECRNGPIMKAAFDAVQVPHPSKPNKMVWSVKSPVVSRLTLADIGNIQLGKVKMGESL